MTKNYEPAKPDVQSLFTEPEALDSLIAQGRPPRISEGIVIENGVPRRKYQVIIPPIHADGKEQNTLDEYTSPISAFDAYQITTHLDLFG